MRKRIRFIVLHHDSFILGPLFVFLFGIIIGACASLSVNESENAGMVLIPAGAFIMGSGEGEGNANEHPQHRVSLDGFWLDTQEVTNTQFKEFIETTGYVTDAQRRGKGWIWQDGWKEMPGADWLHPKGPSSGIEHIMNHPVVRVSWNDANAYCRWAGKRLPTEAEWEYACRAGTTGRYSFGEYITHAQANFSSTGDANQWDGTAPVGSFPPNAWGLHDMHGNVWEWCQDYYDERYYYHSPEHNPVNEAKSMWRVMRGGAWDYCALGMRSAYRGADFPFSASDARGFRCARTVDAAQHPATDTETPADNIEGAVK
jgi:formylglycine-generating enzyme required for sulfatase activity